MEPWTDRVPLISRSKLLYFLEFRLCGRISSSGPNFVFGGESCFRGQISSSRVEFRVQGRISSSGPNFAFRTDFRRISSSGPSFVFRAGCCLQGRIWSSGRNSSSARPKTEFVFTGISSSGPIFVFKFRLRAQFQLQLPANNFVFKSFGISASGGGDETGTQFPGSMYSSTQRCLSCQ